MESSDSGLKIGTVVSDRGLNIGTVAPNFSTINISDENLFSLHEEAKKHRGILINFLRGNF